jgi:hypothetical protein
MSKFARGLFTIGCLSLVLVCPTACRRQSVSENETPDTSTYRPESTPSTQFERDLKYERDARFQHLWIFARKDGKPLTKDDSAILRTNAPKVVDWVLTDEGRKVIAGSNFDIDPANMTVLQKRFNVEDYSGK